MYHKSQKVIQIIDYFIKVSLTIFMITLVFKFFVLKFIIVLAFSFLLFSVFYSIKNLFLSID